MEGKSWNDDGPSALRSAPPLPASGSVEVAAVEAQALVPLSSSLFIGAHPGPTLVHRLIGLIRSQLNTANIGT